MNRWIILAGLALTTLTLACGGSDDQTASKTPPVEAAAPVAKAPTSAPAPAAPEKTPDVAAAPEDATKRCLALAAQQKWSEALDPCTQAAKDHPTDLRVKHAVQQAQAAAEG